MTSTLVDYLISNPVNIYTYIYKQDLVLNNPQGLICHKTPTNQPMYGIYIDDNFSFVLSWLRDVYDILQYGFGHYRDIDSRHRFGQFLISSV